MTFSKFDTQIQIEETEEYQPTAADLAELEIWIDELDAELDEDEEPDEWDDFRQANVEPEEFYDREWV
jgi:hypothetical protein